MTPTQQYKVLTRAVGLGVKIFFVIATSKDEAMTIVERSGVDYDTMSANLADVQ